jgi:pyridoxine 4-dehydrogenase
MMTMSDVRSITAAAAGTLQLGDISVNRMGYGAMRITGPGVWGPPADPKQAIATLKRAVELGVNLIDTADSYGPNVSEDFIAEALAPYPPGVVITTKGGWQRIGPGQWIHNGSPKHLREAVEGSLTRLRLDRIDIYQFHIPDPAVSFDASCETLAQLREEGKIRHIGLSNVTLEHLQRAQKIVPIVSVQNRYSFADREWDYLLDYCELNGITFMPWAPLAQNTRASDALDSVAAQLGVKPLQIALAWLLQRSPVLLPIPGTSKLAHLEENIQAAALRLPEPLFKMLSEVVSEPMCLRK